MLERGGNAFDAAVAAGFVLQVVEPHLNGPGGEVPILLYSAERDEVLVVDGQGTAPAAATIERFRELGHELVPGTGLLAACVPGAFDAWLLLLREFGTLPLADVLEPAIGYAESGYPLVPGICADIARMEQVFRDEWPALGRAVPAGAEAGHALPQPRPGRDLPARARRVGRARELLRRLRRRGDRRGAARCSPATTSPRGTPRSSSRSRAATSGWDVYKTGPWGQGPVFLQQLALLEGFELGDREGPDFVHTVVECAKLAFADREAWYGDGDVPLDDLLSAGVRGRAAQARERRGLGRAAARQPGRPRAAAPAHPRGATAEPGHRRADPRRHLPRRRGRPLRQRRLGHAQRRLAARLAGDPRARLLPRHAGADVLARGGPAELARAAQAAADDALAHARPPRRRDAGLRHAGRRPAGPVVARLLPDARPLRPERAGGDRRADVPHRALPGVVLPAAAAAADAAAREPLPAARPRTSCGGAGTSSSARSRGRSAA